MRTTLIAYLCIATAPLSFEAFADTATLNPSKDNTLIQTSDGSLSNALGDIYVGRTGQSDTSSRRRGVIHFDVAGELPAGATIQSAELQLYLNLTNDSTSRTVYLHPATASWGEGTSYYNGGLGDSSTTNDATWVHRFYSATSWTNTGGDYDATATQSESVGVTYQYYVWDSNAAMVADVQDWLDTPSTNYGWVIIGDESASGTARRFTSREGDSAELPKLVITYTTSPLRGEETKVTAGGRERERAIADLGAGRVRVLVNSASGEIAVVAVDQPDSARRTLVPAGSSLRFIDVKDVDGDGTTDLVLRDEDAGVLLAANQRTGGLSTRELRPGSDPGDPLRSEGIDGLVAGCSVGGAPVSGSSGAPLALLAAAIFVAVRRRRQ